jgi:hypothetical protein
MSEEEDIGGISAKRGHDHVTPLDNRQMLH